MTLMTNSMEKPWLQHYPAGVPAHIDPSQYNRVIDMVEESFQKFADQPAFIFMGKTMTFKELDEKSMAFGAYLRSRGLEPGDRVALMMPNLMQYPIAMFGVLRAGLILVNTNPLYTPREMKHQFADSGAKAILIAENFAANLQQIIGETQIKTVMVTSIGEMLGLKGAIVNFVVRRIKKMVPKFNIPNTVCFLDALKQGQKFTIPAFQGGPDDTIALQYTGGTTGVSKGTMLTNRNANPRLVDARTSGARWRGDTKPVCITALPYLFFYGELPGIPKCRCLQYFDCQCSRPSCTHQRMAKTQTEHCAWGEYAFQRIDEPAQLCNARF
jgi:long-chain acyl-CoA synthetase